MYRAMRFERLSAIHGNDSYFMIYVNESSTNNVSYTQIAKRHIHVYNTFTHTMKLNQSNWDFLN